MGRRRWKNVSALKQVEQMVRLNLGVDWPGLRVNSDKPDSLGHSDFPDARGRESEANEARYLACLAVDGGKLLA
jgi:hypothetical protein